MGDLISREWLVDAFDNLCCHNCKNCRNFRIEDSFYKCALIDNAPTVEPQLSDKQIDKITDLLETEWGYKGIREDVTRILREADND